MWEIDFAKQIISFFYSMLLGGVFGILHDIFHLPIRKKEPSEVAIFVINIFYFAFIGLINFCFLLAVSNGKVRAYLLLGDLIGFLVYKKTVSPIVTLVLFVVFKPIKTVFSVLNKGFSSFSNLIWKSFLNIGKKIWEIIKKLLKKG